MKNRVIVSALCIVLGILKIEAQPDETEKNYFDIGVDLGFNVANVQSKRDIETSAKLGFNFSAFATYYISKSFGIKTKVIYDNKGYGDATIFDEVAGDLVNTDININYITIPLMGSLFIGKGDRFYINAGAYIGFLLHAKETEFKTDISEIFEKKDYGIAAGFGMIFQLNDWSNFIVEYDSQYGIVKPTIEEFGSNIRTRRHSLNFGYSLSLK